jgi:hypothetical protein
MIDKLTVAYLRSQNVQPEQMDMEELFTKSTRVQIMEMVFEGRTGRFQPRLEFTKSDDLSALRKCLTIKATTNHLMMMGELCMKFCHHDDRIARIDIVSTCILRWSDRWKNDAYLTEPMKFAEFLKSHGFAKLRETIDRDAEAERKSIAAHAAWEATWIPAIPAGLAPLVEELSNEIYAPEPKARPRALALLAAHYPSVDERILALFAWYGHGSGPWNGFPSCEAAPASMLQSFATDEILNALESQPLSRQHLEGVARYLWIRARAQRDLVDRCRASRICPQILSYIRSTQDSSKIEAIERVLG